VPALPPILDLTPAERDGLFVKHLSHDDPVEGCPHCAVRPLLSVLYEAWYEGTSAERALLWSMQDGYGAPGATPAQGHDWSGLRDSTPATVHAMHEALLAHREEPKPPYSDTAYLSWLNNTKIEPASVALRKQP
jgi:hypothetical protein